MNMLFWSNANNKIQIKDDYFVKLVNITCIWAVKKLCKKKAPHFCGAPGGIEQSSIRSSRSLTQGFKYVLGPY